MSQEANNEALKQAVRYLGADDEPLESRVNAVENAVETADFDMEDVIHNRARYISEDGAVYPSQLTHLREVQKAIHSETKHAPGAIEEICSDLDFITTKDDVIERSLYIFNKEDHSNEEKQKEIKHLVNNAQRSGIDITNEGVVKTLQEYSSATEYRGSGEEETATSGSELVNEIKYPDGIKAGEEYVYRVSVSDEDKIQDIDWYVGGTHQGTGTTLLHKFEYTGRYSLSVEVTRADGEVEHITEDIDVKSPSGIEIGIVGDTNVNTKEEVTYSANAETTNTTLQSIQWEINGLSVGTGDEITHTFEEPGESTVTVTAITEEGEQAVETIEIDVDEKSDIKLDLKFDDEVTQGEEVTIIGKIESENATIDEVSLTIGNEEVNVPDMATVSLDWEFETTGEHEISLAAVNTKGKSAITTQSINVHPKPFVELYDIPDYVLLGDVVTAKAEKPDGVSLNWSVENASLTSVGDSEATVEFTSAAADTGIVSIEARNDIDATSSDERTVDVRRPGVDVWVNGPRKATVGSTIEFSAAESEVKNAAITSIKWKDEDGEVLGEGESLKVTFTDEEIGEHEITANVQTDQGVADSETIEVTVEPETDVTAIAVITGGSTTEDTFTFDASNSTSKNSEIVKYEWDVEDVETLEGETVQVGFETPGTYEVTLRAKTETDDVDTDTKTVAVKPYTDVDPKITGPENVTIGEQGEFTVADSDLVNTTISSVKWYLNGRPVGSGESFIQTFSEQGHYSIDAEIVTGTGDEDSTTASVTVSKPEPEVTARFEVRNPVVGRTTTFNGSESKVEYGQPTEWVWEIDGEDDYPDDKQVSKSFDEYKKIDVRLTLKSRDGQAGTAEDTVYILPDPEDPPYEKPTSESTKTDLLEEVETIYSDNDLPIHAKNWFGAKLQSEAEEQGIALTRTEIEAKAAEVSELPEHEISIEDTGALFEQKRSESNWDILEGTVEESSTESDSGGWVVGDTTEEGGFDLTLDDESDETDDSGGGWDVTTGEEEKTDTNLETDITDEEPLDSMLEEETTEGDVNEDIFSPDTTDPYSDIVEQHKESKNPPETYSIGNSVFSMPNYAQDLVDFDFVFEQNDDLLPEGVNGAGIVVTNNDTYVGLARVKGRDWSIHTPAKKHDLIKKYEKSFLIGLDSEIQIISLPTKFDIEDHISRVEAVLDEYQDDSDEYLMNIARAIYPSWMESFMQENDMRERNFYIALPLSADHLSKFKSSNDGVAEKLEDAPIIGGLMDRFTDDSADNISKYQILREINSRLERIDADLRRMDIEIERVTNRDEALAVLYHYYHDMEPRSEVFPMGGYSSVDKKASVGGMPIDSLLTNTEKEEEQQ